MMAEDAEVLCKYNKKWMYNGKSNKVVMLMLMILKILARNSRNDLLQEGINDDAII